MEYASWGRYPQVRHAGAVPLFWRHELPDLAALPRPVLPYGLGRSYGDSCLNRDGYLLLTRPLNRFIFLDEARRRVRCEAGVTLAELQRVLIARGLFLPVLPGTEFVTVGGAIANDIHGKNHHRAGTFGRHVCAFELVRSDRGRLLCTPAENRELFRATIGGLGLTGLITWAELAVRPVPSPFIWMERFRYRDLEEFFDLTAASDRDYEYTVAWVDTMARGPHLGRGLFMRGNHADPAEHRLPPAPRPRYVRFPINAPGWFLNRAVVKFFNTTYYWRQLPRRMHKLVYYVPFFHPLDAILDWNRMYGRRGFLQYQCVVPFQEDRRAVRTLLQTVAASGRASFLAVLKVFGDVPSPGLLSFPRPGVTLAMDFRFEGPDTLALLDRLDAIVRDVGGRVYPAKDARMSPASFRHFFPAWEELAQAQDPRFSSSFWRRVTRRERG